MAANEAGGLFTLLIWAPLRGIIRLRRSLGKPLAIRLDQQGDGDTEFRCTTGSRLIASGCLRYRIVCDDPKGDS